MNWSEFHEKYILEADITGTVDVQFFDNTPLFPINCPRFSQIRKVRVLDKKTFKLVKEYVIPLNFEQIRQVNNPLRNSIMKDFNIEEVGVDSQYPHVVALSSKQKEYDVQERKSV